MTTSVEDRTLRLDALIEQIAGTVLTNGLDILVLRDLASRLGTSARMLIYYFDSKEQLVERVLQRISDELTLVLSAHSTGPRVTPAHFLATVLSLSDDPSIKPFMRVWTEVISRGARGESPYAEISKSVVTQWMRWIDSRLEPSDDPLAMGRPAAILSLVEGMALLELASPGSTRHAADFLVKTLSSA